MKIGIFGDSFVEKKYFLNTGNCKTWYYLLKDLYEHEVDVYGESGSSIMFSAKLIEQYAAQYDLVIWALTIPGCCSFYSHSNKKNYHFSSSNTMYSVDDVDIAKKVKIFLDYSKYVVDEQDENFLYRALVSHLTTIHQNIMVLPCFPYPLQTTFDLYNFFNLYAVSVKEAQHYFPNKNMAEISQNYMDIRPGHLTDQNHKILSKLINDNLSPKIFQTDFKNFVTPTDPLEKVFQKL